MTLRRMRPLSLRQILGGGVSALVLAACSRGGDPPPPVGSPAPDFTLPSQEGALVSPHDFRGKWVVLYFYPKDFTSGCTLEAHNFQRDSAQYVQRNAVIVGVSFDAPDSHKQFCAKEGLNFKLLADTTHAVATTYGSVMHIASKALAARNTFLIDPNGVIAREFIKVNPATHSDSVLAALTELQHTGAGTGM
jgi:thioredoxin-dependent peroxiredoxin